MKSKYIPIFSAGLIFLGFVLNQGYYYHFGLNITNFFTTGELILSFLDVSLIVIIVIFWFFYFFYSQIKTHKNKLIELKKKEKSIVPDEQGKQKKSTGSLGKNLNHLWLNVKYYIFKKGSKPTISFLEAIFNTLSLIFIWFMFLTSTYYYLKGYIEKKGGLDSSSYTFFFICFIWILIIIVNFKKSFEDISNSELFKSDEKAETKPAPFWLLITLFLSCFSVSLWAHSSFKAFTILKNQPKYEFEIKTTDDYYESTDDLIFVGQTSNYLFIRELSTEKNIILRTDNIDFFSLKKIQKEKPKPQPRKFGRRKQE